MNKILLVGAFVQSVWNNVINRVSLALAAENGFEVKDIRLGSSAEPCSYLGAKNQKELKKLFYSLADTWKPDIVLAIGELGQLLWLQNVPHRHRFKWITYFCLFAEPVSMEWWDAIGNMDLCIAGNKYTFNLVHKNSPTSKIELIYPGLEPELKLLDRANLRKEYGLDGKFVIGCIAENDLHSNIPAVLKAFVRFAANNDDALLYLGSSDRTYWDLHTLLVQYGIEEKTISFDIGEISKDLAHLARIYNLLDLFVLAGTGEDLGWRLAEAQACGTPVIATDCVVYHEMVPNKAQLIKVSEYLTLQTGWDCAIADWQCLYDLIAEFYVKKYLKHTFANSCKQIRRITLQKVITQFVEAIKEIEDDDGHANCVEGQLPRFYRV